jgi:hypothetical protein
MRRMASIFLFSAGRHTEKQLMLKANLSKVAHLTCTVFYSLEAKTSKHVIKKR